MKKKFFLLFSLFVTLNIFSQQKIALKGIILDQDKLPVPYASIGIISKNIGTTSTEEGTFNFIVTNKEKIDYLEISSIGYQTFKITVNDFLSRKNKTIILKEKTTELSEISIMNTEDYVKMALKNLKNNSVSKNHQLKILYRRWSVEDNICRFYIEHFMNVIDRGPSSYITKYAIEESRKSSEYRYIKNLQNRHAIEYMELNNPLRKGIYHGDYKWKKIENSSYDGEDINIIEGLNDTSSLKLYIGYDTFKIYKLEITRNPPKKGKYLHSLYLYKKNKEGKLYLSYHNREWRGSGKLTENMKRILLKQKKITGNYIPIAYRHEVFVLELEQDKKRFEKYKTIEEMDMTLYNIPYNKYFWDNVSLPPETLFYKKNSRELESLFNVPIESQFKLSN
ncbi:MAG: carboxypeptidase-like regulatory domain-containing protein [Flavobacteriaceae bacterium]|nr:carboxypeptidase-like regulatory domain-containing protein [Flavobacteriaceae bacterium]